MIGGKRRVIDAGIERGGDGMGDPQGETGDLVAESLDAVIVDLTDWEDASRYRRQSGVLPRLADDPSYTPDTHALPHPVKESTGLFARMKAKIAR